MENDINRIIEELNNNHPNQGDRLTTAEIDKIGLILIEHCLTLRAEEVKTVKSVIDELEEMLIRAS